ncbi:MAG TPA: hypothetical protein PLT55_00540 [Acidimicrobiia bacterium]|nr:hypothetical protein [Acidimicrobiia bacterium]
MEVEEFSPVCISGNPSEEELVAISAAYTSLLRSIVDKSVENVVENGALWANSSNNRVNQGSKYVGLAGSMQSWQQSLRIVSRI